MGQQCENHGIHVAPRRESRDSCVLCRTAEFPLMVMVANHTGHTVAQMRVGSFAVSLAISLCFSKLQISAVTASTVAWTSSVSILKAEELSIVALDKASATDMSLPGT